MRGRLSPLIDPLLYQLVILLLVVVVATLWISQCMEPNALRVEREAARVKATQVVVLETRVAILTRLAFATSTPSLPSISR